ncbi:CU044_2847 family protein [Dongia sp.]|uniref:CU044_2847 family protein n=1 Tax=Dongia sp. TaxID=1977262 RepID=UPI0037517CBB
MADPNNPEKSTVILFESSSGDMVLPAGVRGIEEIQGVAKDFGEQLQPVILMARQALESLKSIAPGKIQIEFGIEVGGKAGIPLVTEGSAKANFKVTLAWP